MPSIFKALASITAWILFISGCVGVVVTAINRITGAGLGVTDIGTTTEYLAAVAQLIAAVVVMRLRQKME